MKWIKSKTNQATIMAMLQALPQTSDPVFGYMLDAGVPGGVVSGLKIAAILGTFFYGIYGRKVAKGPL